jgi:hypothetical protein
MKKEALDVHAVLSVPAVLAGAMPLRARHHTPWGCRSKFTEIYRNLPKFTEIYRNLPKFTEISQL